MLGKGTQAYIIKSILDTKLMLFFKGDFVAAVVSMEKNPLLKWIFWIGERSLLVKYLPYKHGDSNLILRNHIKNQM